MSFSLATYNVLANTYANRAWYRRTPSMVLNPAWRVPALVQHISALKTDVLCLQEVEPDVFATLRASLAASRYNVQYARKSGDHPDGVAIFYHREKFELVSASRFIFADGEGDEADSGYIALITMFRASEGVIGVINTHLLWDPPGTSSESRRGYRQARQLLAEWEKIAGSANAWILAGDFNVTPDDALIGMIRRAGFDYAHCGLADAATCNVHGEARMIDYIFYSHPLCCEPEAITPVHDLTVLPSADQPSDHVAVAARFTWKS
ncbi:MAG TPA: endonuclease/exonuclease/phosphatase family protein [Candidatus Binatia bacterium]|nr:endonuclease/exonuclease/phosphatase family protein [Candidatus Binatia bacterium]